MKKTFILLPALAMLIFASTACTQKADRKSTVDNSPPTKSVSITAPLETNESPAITSINFEAMKYNFGEKKASDDFTHTFTFTNTGENDLILTNVKGTCSCTVTEYTKEAVKPGETGTVTAKFNPKKDFTGAFKKSIKVAANVEPANLILEIAGEIVN